MSKVALITDTHFGAREDREVFHSFFQKFYDNIFFPELKKRGIKTIINLGDTFDRRKFVNFNTLKRSKEYFFDPIKRDGIKMYMLVGNHDIFLRNSLSVNSPELLLKDYTNIIPISKPEVITIDGTDILMLPWICGDNSDQSFNLIKNSGASACLGHLEITGFEMYRGMESHEGFSQELFSNFSLVCSGHYHHRSRRGNICYLGNPYEITAMDCGDVRGFHILDTETLELEFIPNTFTIFNRYVYNDEQEDPRSIDVSLFKEKFLKIVVQKKTDFYKFDTFLDRVYNVGCHEVKIIDDVTEMAVSDLDESVDVEDTITILKHYVENSDVYVDKKHLSDYINQLYIEALNVKV